MKETNLVTGSVIIVGSGLAGMVAGYEALKGGKHVIFLEQENRNNLGGQAFWSLGGVLCRLPRAEDDAGQGLRRIGLARLGQLCRL